MKPTLKDAITLLSEINKKLDNVIEGQAKMMMEMQGAITDARHPRKNMKMKGDSPPLDVVTLLAIPDHLRETAMTLSKLGDATAGQVARETGKTREAESAKLNQLYRMALVNRRRKGHRVIFSPL